MGGGGTCRGAAELRCRGPVPYGPDAVPCWAVAAPCVPCVAAAAAAGAGATWRLELAAVRCGGCAEGARGVVCAGWGWDGGWGCDGRGGATVDEGAATELGGADVGLGNGRED